MESRSCCSSLTNSACKDFEICILIEEQDFRFLFWRNRITLLRSISLVDLKFLSDDNRSSKEPDMKMKSTAELTLHKRTLDAVETFYTWITYRIRITLLFSESPNCNIPQRLL